MGGYRTKDDRSHQLLGVCTADNLVNTGIVVLHQGDSCYSLRDERLKHSYAFHRRFPLLRCRVTEAK